jgi:hypothetical protein
MQHTVLNGYMVDRVFLFSRRNTSYSNVKSLHGPLARARAARAREVVVAIREVVIACRAKWYFRDAVRCATMAPLGRLRPRFSPRKQASAHVAQTSVATKLSPRRVRERDPQTAPTCVLDDPVAQGIISGLAARGRDPVSYPWVSLNSAACEPSTHSQNMR